MDAIAGRKRSILRGLAFCFCVSMAATVEGDAIAQEQQAAPEEAPPEEAQGLTPEEEQALSTAVARGELVSLKAIVIAAIARSSDQTSEIIKDLYRLAPNYVGEVIEAARQTFPELAERLTAAAEEAVSEETGKHPALTEQLPEPEPKRWSGEVALGGSYKNAKTNSLTTAFDASVDYEGELWEHHLGGSLDYGKKDGVTDTHRFLIEGKTQRSMTERLYLFGLAEYEDDRFSGFDYQVTEGVGVGYKIFDTPSFKLNAEGGPSYRQTKVEATEELNDELLARLALGLEWNISDSASFKNETSFFLAKDQVNVVSKGVTELDDERQASNLSVLDMTIIGNLAARVSYDLRYRSNPPPGTASTTSLVKFLMVQKF